ncbi:hypothetical protein AVEN_261755-1 [Araneus ventricosus]|uniref:Uncharacterized protein n=1 Tax=Araneus ventricosus TaxID=182803 RepID=A0A4Y2UIA4_ARAVE|nr:hypothetical protein AVEN_261755-1 [Araneus ventricosus]
MSGGSAVRRSLSAGLIVEQIDRSTDADALNGSALLDPSSILEIEVVARLVLPNRAGSDRFVLIVIRDSGRSWARSQLDYITHDLCCSVASNVHRDLKIRLMTRNLRKVFLLIGMWAVLGHEQDQVGSSKRSINLWKLAPVPGGSTSDNLLVLIIVVGFP